MKQEFNIDCFHFVYDNESRELVCTMILFILLM